MLVLRVLVRLDRRRSSSERREWNKNSKEVPPDHHRLRLLVHDGYYIHTNRSFAGTGRYKKCSVTAWHLAFTQ